MTPVEALIWFVCMTIAVFLTIAGGVFLAVRSGNPHPQQAHAPRLHLPGLHHRS